MIHPTAIIRTGAELAEGVEVGPYSIIGPHVVIDKGTSIGAHVVIDGHTRIGKDNRIFPFSSLGAAPQDKKYADEPTSLEIGDRNVIREFCTFNIGTVQDVGVTRLGNDNWMMAYTHLAHDCQVGNNTVFANNAQLAGHVEVGDYAILGGFTSVHQYCRIGAHCITGLGSVVLKDVPPYVTAAGNSAEPHGINAEGLKRRGFSPETIAALRQAYKTLYKSGMSFEEAKEALTAQSQRFPEVKLLLDFLLGTQRGIIR